MGDPAAGDRSHSCVLFLQASARIRYCFTPRPFCLHTRTGWHGHLSGRATDVGDWYVGHWLFLIFLHTSPPPPLSFRATPPGVDLVPYAHWAAALPCPGPFFKMNPSRSRPLRMRPSKSRPPRRNQFTLATPRPWAEPLIPPEPICLGGAGCPGGVLPPFTCRLAAYNQPMILASSG